MSDARKFGSNWWSLLVPTPSNVHPSDVPWSPTPIRRIWSLPPNGIIFTADAPVETAEPLAVFHVNDDVTEPFESYWTRSPWVFLKPYRVLFRKARLSAGEVE